MKKKLIGLSVLVVLSGVVFVMNFNDKNKSKEDLTIPQTDTTINTNIESKLEDIVKENELPNESNKEKTVIWIKNINFLANNNISYSDIMALKTKLNTELKTLDSTIYEVNLLEETFKKTDNGFKIEAKADKVKEPIKIELIGYEYKFTVSY